MHCTYCVFWTFMRTDIAYIYNLYIAKSAHFSSLLLAIKILKYEIFKNEHTSHSPSIRGLKLVLSFLILFLSWPQKKVSPEMINHLCKSWPDKMTITTCQDNLQQICPCSTLDIWHEKEWDLSTVGEFFWSSAHSVSHCGSLMERKMNIWISKCCELILLTGAEGTFGPTASRLFQTDGFSHKQQKTSRAVRLAHTEESAKGRKSG